jgi:hypothetical protein
MWVLDHLKDLESDFSVLHRVEDVYSLDGPRFFEFAERIFAYPGVMRARVEAESTGSGTRIKNGTRVAKTTRELQSFAPGAGERVVIR